MTAPHLRICSLHPLETGRKTKLKGVRSLFNQNYKNVQGWLIFSFWIPNWSCYDQHQKRSMSMGKINSRCFQLELYLQFGQGVKGKTMFYSSWLWIQEGFTWICSGQNRLREQNLPHSLGQAAVLFLCGCQFYAPSMSKSHMMAPLPHALAVAPPSAAPGPSQGC